MFVRFHPGTRLWWMCLILIAVLIGLIVWLPGLRAQGTAVLVKDINPSTDDAFPNHLRAIGSTMFFFADDGVHGGELWTSDGTAAGTRLVKDLLPGKSAPSIAMTTTLGSLFFFAADDALWRSDGTSDGTFLLLRDPRFQNYWRRTAVVQDALYFLLGGDLWRSDGTVEGTIKTAQVPSTGGGVIAANNLLFFAGRDATNGVELWVSDGTTVGTRLVKNLETGWADSNPYLYLANERGVYFSAFTSALGRELYFTDGTAEGTVLVKDVAPGSSSGNSLPLAELNGTLYFMADVPGSEVVPGAALWRTDGTPDGTLLLKTFPRRNLYEQGGVVGNRVIFDAGTQIWTTDGTTDGTRVLLDAPDRGFNITTLVSDPAQNVGYLNTAPDLWRTDGTPEGTHKISQATNGTDTIDSLSLADGRLFFSADDGVHGFELWTGDGTVEGMAMVMDLNSTGHGSWPDDPIAVGGTLYFTADDGTQHGSRYLWQSDGTTDGTRLVNRTGLVTGPTGLPQFIAMNGTLVFVGSDTAGEVQLWRATPGGGATKVKAFPGPSCCPGPTFQLTVLHDRVFFTVDDGIHGMELWTSNGTPAGTRLVADLTPGADGSRLFDLVALGDALFFVRRSGEGMYELWKTDGTTVGTTRITTITGLIGYDTFGTFYLTSANSRLFFYARDDEAGTELWTSDGTAEGTRRVADLVPGDFSSAPHQLMAVGELVFFLAQDETGQIHLWRSDGTPTGTIQLTRFTEDFSYQAEFHLFTSYREMLYFRVNDGVHGMELWQSDGTVAGTRLLADIAPGAAGSDVQDLTVVGGWLYFTAYHPDSGWEIWRTDGTTAGTELALDFTPGPHSAVWWLHGANGMVFFSGADGRGLELWRLPRTLHPAITPQVYLPRTAR